MAFVISLSRQIETIYIAHDHSPHFFPNHGSWSIRPFELAPFCASDRSGVLSSSPCPCSTTAGPSVGCRWGWPSTSVSVFAVVVGGGWVRGGSGAGSRPGSGFPKSSTPSLRWRAFHTKHRASKQPCIIPAAANGAQLVQFVLGLPCSRYQYSAHR
jgi:hypothetical protein